MLRKGKLFLTQRFCAGCGGKKKTSSVRKVWGENGEFSSGTKAKPAVFAPNLSDRTGFLLFAATGT
jgi:hypothetical protein